MLEPGALGTLVIGLDAIPPQEEAHAIGGARRTAARRNAHAARVRRLVAAFLHNLAEWLEPMPRAASAAGRS
jgi:hypothetical protein